MSTKTWIILAVCFIVVAIASVVIYNKMKKEAPKDTTTVPTTPPVPPVPPAGS